MFIMRLEDLGDVAAAREESALAHGQFWGSKCLLKVWLRNKNVDCSLGTTKLYGFIVDS